MFLDDALNKVGDAANGGFGGEQESDQEDSGQSESQGFQQGDDQEKT